MDYIPYCGPAPHPGGVLAAWNFDPVVLVALALLTLGLHRRGLRVRIGLGLLALAYVSPLCALSAGLFSARTVHHLVIVLGAAPLLAEALRLDRVRLVPALIAHLAVFWLWHLPAAYELALSSDLAYWIGQFALLGSAILLWRALGREDILPTSVFFVIAAMVMQMGMLGAILTFAPHALYAPHFLTTQGLGFGVLEDQQIAGLIMWVGSLPLTILAGWPPLVRLFTQTRRRIAA
ncbi:cytochrome c oxidase assembly protein [Erythrobacter sp. NFXS35]|uniref:cytochrome c oxidase assembly protein n=1 Tax=Erythrobacter sp. NFXS35 TaxID=2818436 RepID=UPI0032DE977D